ncbi:uncharacterized protein [Neodiprion pinetum]|uniref:uncharacterized protein n=1 Tax=Neodiprion pinetum TaxID=441929 RepID=UPI001EDE169F|nr:uncharacterized protein LOC124217276 [Neodiprion pinetum]
MDQLSNILADPSSSNLNFTARVNNPSNDQISYLTNKLDSIEKEKSAYSQEQKKYSSRHKNLHQPGPYCEREDNRLASKLDNSSPELTEITFWNLHGFSNLQHSSLINHSTIIAACETWNTQPFSPPFLANYNTYWSNAIRNHAIGRVIYLRKCLDLRYLLDILEEVIDGIKSSQTYDIFIIGGDLNAKVGSLNPWPEDLFTGLPLNPLITTTDETICNRGRMLMLDSDFILLNGRTIGDFPAQPTFDNRGTSIIDLVWIDISALHLIVDLEVILEPSLSDHRPVRLTIHTETLDQHHACAPQATPHIKEKIVWSEEAKLTYQNHLLSSQDLPDVQNDPTDTTYNWLLSSIHSAAQRSNKSFKFNQQSKSVPYPMEKKKAYILNIKNAFANVSVPSNFWAAVKKFSFRKGAQCESPVNTWNAFYATVYKPRIVIPSLLAKIVNNTLDAEISLTELDATLASLKSGKAPGPDLVLEHVPRSWAITQMIMIHKKGDKSEPSNYRDIALVNTITKIFTTLLKKRLVTWAEQENHLPECQLGFRKNRGCTEAIFSLISSIQLQFRHKDGREIFGIFVDFQRAFDSVPHTLLWEKLHRMSLSSKFINTTKSLYDQATLQVKAMESKSNVFEVTEGVLQGEALSPDLFLLFIADIEHFFRSKGYYGLSINGLTDILMLLYADDTVIFAHSPIDLLRKLRVLEEYCDANGLTVNKSKTKIVTSKSAGRTRDCLSQYRMYKGSCLEVVKSYSYLGVNISSSMKGLRSLHTAITRLNVPLELL